MNTYCWDCNAQFSGLELHTCVKCKSRNVYVGEKPPQTKCYNCGNTYRGEYATCPGCKSPQVQVMDASE